MNRLIYGIGTRVKDLLRPGPFPRPRSRVHHSRYHIPSMVLTTDVQLHSFYLNTIDKQRSRICDSDDVDEEWKTLFSYIACIQVLEHRVSRQGQIECSRFVSLEISKYKFHILMYSAHRKRCSKK